MIKEVYASELGKCYAKSNGGFMRLYKVDGNYSIYLVSREAFFNDDCTAVMYGKRLTASFGGHLNDPANFESGCWELQQNLAILARDEN